MPVYTVQMPDGTKLDIQGPEGATNEQLFAVAQNHLQTAAQIANDPISTAARNTPLLPPIDPRQSAAVDRMLADSPENRLSKAAYNAGGKVTDIGSNLGLPPQVSAGLGFGANVLTQAIPTFIGAQLGKQSIQPLLQSGAKRIMQSAVKPTLADLKSGDAAKAITTMLKEGYNPTESGVRAMQAKIDELAAQVKNAISNSTATVNKYAVGNRLMDALNRFKAQVNPKADMNAIESAWNEFLSHPDLAGKTTMPVQLAQQMKTGTYNAIGNRPYGELSGASTEAQKQLARGLKEEISAAVPQVAPLNAREAELINARNIAQRRALMSGNRNPAGLAPLAGHGIGTVGFLADRSDLIKALLARLLYSGSGIFGTGTGAVAGGLLGASSGMPPDQTGILKK